MTSKFRNRLRTGAALMVAFAATPVFATETAVDAAVDGGDVAEIVVLGQGQARQVQEIGAADIALEVAGISPLKAIDKLPGVNFQSADPFGTYEWSSRISIRGFSQQQLGFTLDGVPLGDMSYGNHNGLHISRAIISENVGRVEVAQGAGSLSAASTSNLGGTIEFSAREPAETFEVEASGTYGSEDTKRAFVRIDSGEIAPGGPRLALSYAWQDGDKWKGDGVQRQHQFNGRIVQPVGDGQFFGFVNYSDRRENDYQDLSQAMIDRLGYDWDNFAKDWDLAVRVAHIAHNRGDTGVAPTNPAAGTVYPTPIQTVDDAYYDAAGLRKDWLAGVGVEAPLNAFWTLNAMGYYHGNEGRGMWFTPYVATPGGAPMALRTTEYEIERYGIVANSLFTLGANRVEIGMWYEDNDFNQARRFYGLGNTAGAPDRSSLKFPTDPLLTQWEFDFNTQTLQYHVQDTLDLGQVQINAGWKGLRVTNLATPIVRGSLAAGRTEAKDWFLPQAGLLFRLSDDNEAFASYTQNMRAFESSATGGPFATTQAGFDALDLKPETSTTYELGFRTKSPRFQGVIAGYYVDFKDRIIAFANGSGIQGNPAILQNVGDVRSWGVEAAGTFRVTTDLSLFASYAYNDSEYQDDVVNAAGTIIAATAGKTVVNSPRHLAKGEITWDTGSFFARVGANYTSKRYYSFENDAEVGGFVIVDASIGYRFNERISVQANATNLFDRDYVSTIGTNGFANRGDSQTLLAGAPQQFFVTVKAGF
ncbi:TonB-dependent receptor [Sphingopyxis bauzanensis]|uniref:TonB-dependent receptor n=1 Tax=Sphingopyxis bauzanensis TaxID=651663 RepID=A0A246JPU6_9SPHN|nr:TonB-dependent receptor [Sphingopyxis bauzanensis]OWQ94847.1 TonB-dependent receptor [Sphingopyxis bauzanensis]GGJ65548.1 TonB-dependent receptor [Sphingopyxis bauzanensis]